jgi:O-antigen/teichoic acid export membrane protein
MQKHTFLKHAGVYALGDLLVNAGGVILLPLYTRFLSKTEFGIQEVLNRTAEVLAICLVARGMAQGVMALYRQSETESQRQRVVGAAVLLGLAATVIGSALLLLLASPLCSALQVESVFLLWAAGLVALLDGVGIVVQTANQARFESGVYVVVSFAQFFVKVLLCIWFVAGLGWGLFGVFLPSLIRSVFFALLLVGREWRIGMAWPDRQTVRKLLAFALPFVPMGVCFFVLNSADRFFILRSDSAADVGVYGLGYQLAMLVGLFSMTPLYRVWSARMHDVARQPDAPAVFGQMTTYLLGAYTFLGLGLCLLADEVIVVFAGRAFSGAVLIVPPVVLAYLFQSAGVLFDAGFYVRRQTQNKLWIAVASTLFMLLLYASLIPSLGLMGAAMATLFGFMFHAALTCYIAQTVFPVRYEWGRLTIMLFLASALWLASLSMAGLWMAPCRLGLWLLWPALLWIGGIVTHSEKQATLAMVRQGWGGARELLRRWGWRADGLAVRNNLPGDNRR